MSPLPSDLPSQHIAIAVVQVGDRILVGQRPVGVPLAGRYEFPGGKVEPGETSQQAALRECWEETGLGVQAVRLLCQTRQAYEHGLLQLDFWLCKLADELPTVPTDSEPVVTAPFGWVERAALATLEFPAGNAEVLALLAKETA